MNNKSFLKEIFLLLSTFVILLTVTTESFAQEKVCNPTTQANIQVSKDKDPDDEEKAVLKAVVTTKSGSPLKDVTVTFNTPRLFGILSHGEASTDESGVALLPFPEEFPGDAKSGHFEVIARVIKHDVYFGESKVTVDGGTKLQTVEDPFPREIWSTKTDWLILVTLPTLIAAVWSVYVFSIAQLVKIARWKS